MIQRTFTYKDYDGNECTESFCFQLTKAEIVEMQVRDNGNFIDNLKDLMQKRDIERLYHFFRELVLDSVGVRSGNNRFVKNSEIREDFKYSIPYSELMVELMTDENKIAEFARGITPFDLSEEDMEKAKEMAAGYVAPGTTSGN